MKQEQEHLMLWQKRNEWQIIDDAQQDWLGMSDMLDAQMPVAGPGISGGSASAYLSGSIKLLGAILVAAAATAVIVYFVFVKGHSKTNSHSKADTAISISNNSQSPNPVVAGSAVDRGAGSLGSGRPVVNSSGSNNTAIAGDRTRDTPSTINDATINSSIVSGAIKSADVRTGDKMGNTTARNNVNRPGTVNAINNAPSDKTGNKITGLTSHNNAFVSGTNNSGSSTSSSHASGKKINVGDKIKSNHSTRSNTIVSRSGNKVNASGLVKGKNAGSINTRGSSGASIAGHGLALSKSLGDLSRSGRRRRPVSGNHYRSIDGSRKNDGSDKRGLSGNANPGSGSSINPMQAVNNGDMRDTAMVQPLNPGLVLAPFAPDFPSALFSKTKAKLDSEMAARKPPVVKPAVVLKFDYGILMGVNTSGSFTAKDQNKNFYGSFPVDVFFGAFTTYNFNDKWGMNLQLRGLNPQTISGAYTHKNDSKKDTNQVLTITDSRKVYTADAALSLVFKPVTGLSLKAGPVFSYGLKEANGNTTFQTGPLKKDSLYYVSVTKFINATTFTKSLNIGLSAGVGYQWGRFVFDVAYIKKFNGITVGSTLGSYTAVNDQVLFSVGFKLNKAR